MDLNNVDDNYFNELNIYVQMFPKISPEVIKLILEETPADTVIDILLQLSNDIPDTDIKDKPASHNTPNQNIPNPPSIPPPNNKNLLTYNTYPSLNDEAQDNIYKSKNSEEDPLISNDNELDKLFECSDEESSSGGLLSNITSIFRRRSSTDKSARFNPDDDL